MKNLLLFALALVLIGAGCLSSNTTQPDEATTVTETEQPSTIVEADNEADVVIEEDEAEEEITVDEPGRVKEFTMVDNPKPATAFTEDVYLFQPVTETQVLKLDLDGDGALEYAHVYTNDQVGRNSATGPSTVQYIEVWKWDGEKWVYIFNDNVVRKDADNVTHGWFNNYEVISVGDGKHGLKVEKTLVDGDDELYTYGQLEDGSFGFLN